jgi:hypothetical protein
MAEPQDELWHDVSVVLKHVRFIAALLVIALVVAVATGLASDPQGRATSEAEIDIRSAAPLFGGTETVLTLDSLAELAESEEVAEAAAQRVGMDPQALGDSIDVSTEAKDVRDSESVDRLIVRATDPSADRAQEIATAVMDAFVQAAERTKSNPLGVESLRRQLTSADGKLRQFDQGELIELAQVQTELSGRRELLASLRAEALTIDQALEVLARERSRPMSELLVAVAGALDGLQGTELEQASTVGELEGGLELRREFVQGVIERAQADVDTLGLREQELIRLTADQSSVLAVYGAAVRNLEAADLAAEQTETEINVTASGVDSSDRVTWLARLSGATAFGLVAGVAGAFAIEFFAPHWRQWRDRRAARAQAERT